MSIVKTTRPVDFSNYSIKEATYMINSFIEESVNDLQVKCLLVDNHSLRENGTLYFTEDATEAAHKLLAKIKAFFAKVWEMIVGIFAKVRDFFKELILNLKVKKIGADKKKYVQGITDAQLAAVVKKNVEKYYDVKAFALPLSDMLNSIDGKGKLTSTSYTDKMNEEDEFSITDKNALAKLITKQAILNSAFGGFRDQYKDLEDKFKKVSDAFKKIKSTAETATSATTYNAEEDTLNVKFRSVKETLKYLTQYSSACSRMIVYNSKVLVKVVNKIVSKQLAKNESVDWDGLI